MAPRAQVPGHYDLQASSSGAQEVAFGAYDEVFIEFFTACKICIAASAAAAAAAIAAGAYHSKSAGDMGSYYKEAGNSIWITNDVDEITSDALETMHYQY